MALQQAVDGDSHVICIDGGDGDGGDSHVLCIDGGDDDDGSVSRRSPPETLDECAVCMERLEWVAVGACGHRAVCAGCAVRLRFRGDCRCCICRAYCHWVIVSKTGGGEAASHHTFDEELARLDACPVGEYWYHSGLNAYFHDEKQYEAAARACREPPPAVRVQVIQDMPEHHPGTGTGTGDDAYCSWLRVVAALFVLFVASFMAGLLFG